jgi:hypothetical protein
MSLAMGDNSSAGFNAGAGLQQPRAQATTKRLGPRDE